jgi:hypothetical protein
LGRCATRGGRARDNRGDEAVAATVERLDGSRGASRIAHRLAGEHDAAAQRCIADDLPQPQRLHQLFLWDHAAAVLDKVHQKVEHLWLGRHEVPGAPNGACGFIDLAVEKRVVHSPLLLSWVLQKHGLIIKSMNSSDKDQDSIKTTS